MAAAFAHTFWWSIGAILIAFIPTLFLPNHAAAAVPATPTERRRATETRRRGPGPRVAGAMLD